MYDFTVVCGHRDKAAQEKALREGKSKLGWPKSRHNSLPSRAVDLAPYCNKIKGIPWDDVTEFKVMATHVKHAAGKLGIGIEWGGDWGTFRDLPHFQLKG